MAGSKVVSGPSVTFASGGPAGKMTGKKVGVQKAGVTSPSMTGTGGKFPMGGKGKMAGKGSSKPARAC